MTYYTSLVTKSMCSCSFETLSCQLVGWRNLLGGRLHPSVQQIKSI